MKKENFYKWFGTRWTHGKVVIKEDREVNIFLAGFKEAFWIFAASIVIWILMFKLN